MANCGVDMRVTSKGQVTIPKQPRERFGLHPGTEVELLADDLGVRIVAARGRERKVAEHLRASADTAMSTDEIMGLTRGP